MQLIERVVGYDPTAGNLNQLPASGAYGALPWLGTPPAEGTPSYGNLLLAGVGRAWDHDPGFSLYQQ